MSSIQVRPFRRSDRDQLTQLVNAHAEAVIPGMTASVNVVLASLERQPGEFIEDPWVAERVTLVAEQQSRVVAAAHLLRYFPDERAGIAARDLGEISWLLYWPEAPAGNPYWPDATAAAAALMSACLGQFRDWGVSRRHAGGELPVHGVYGVPDQWPHIRALYQQAGFTHTGHTEVVYLAQVRDLPSPDGPPLDGLAVRRSVGSTAAACPPSSAGRRSAISRPRSWTRESGWPGTAAGPMWAICMSYPGTVAAERDPGCSGRPPTGSGWPG